MATISEQDLNDWIGSNTIAVLFFKSKACGVCHVQFPHVQSAAREAGVAFKAIDLSENLHLASAHMVLSTPLTKVFFEGKEVFKEGAYLDLNKLGRLLEQLNTAVL